MTRPQKQEAGPRRSDAHDGEAERPVVVGRARTAAEGRAYRADLGRWEQHGEGDAPDEDGRPGNGDLRAAGFGEPSSQPQEAETRRQAEDGEGQASLGPGPGEEAERPANDHGHSL